jgi:dihydrofolate reductase
MAKVLTHMCMSLDGFVAQPDDNPAELFDWYWSGDVVVPSAQESMSFSVDAASAPMLQELTSGCGALIAGRRLFDLTDGWGDNHPAGAPVVVVTHRRDRKTPRRGSRERRSPAASRRRSQLRRRSPATSSSRSPVPTSSSRL